MPDPTPAFPASLFLGQPPLTIAAPALAADERYAGILTSRGQLYHLILLPGEYTADWTCAMTRAAALGADLPAPLEQRLLLDTLPDAFRAEWYWSNTQCRTYGGYAWVQHFGYGHQSYYLKSYECPVRVVRRAVIR